MTYAEAEAQRNTVLVCVLNNSDDLRYAASEGWYRIPQRRAPKRIAADYLAFYQTGAFEAAEEAQTITYYATTRRYRLLTRRELLPNEADHPRANDYYYRIEIGPLQRLPQSIPAGNHLRLTFVHTTFAHLLNAQTVSEIYRQEDPFELLWDALRQHNLRPLKNRLAGERAVDITLRARGGYLGINCNEESNTKTSTKEAKINVLPERWELLHFSAHQLQNDLNTCLRQIGAALINLGGSVLNG